MYTPHEVAAWLGIAPATLRRWAIEFRLWLSRAATQISRGVARRYTDADLIVLAQARAYLARNFTYAEVQSFLQRAASTEIATTDPHSASAATQLISPANDPMPSDPIHLAVNAVNDRT